MNRLLCALLPLSVFFSCKSAPPSFQPPQVPVLQIAVPRIEQMPRDPKPYRLRDWRQTALDFDRYAFDFSAKGAHLPLIWMDEQKRNGAGSTFGLYTAIGDVRQGAALNNGENHEAIAALGAVLGGTLAGVKKNDQDGRNYVAMLRNYFNRDNGWNIVMNFTNKGAHIGGGYGNDYWYDIFNNVLFYGVGNFYRDEPGYAETMRTIADQFVRASETTGYQYNHSYFDFAAMKPGVNHIPVQQDVAAGYAFVLYAAYCQFGDAKYLAAAQKALKSLEDQRENRMYEILMAFAPYVAARLNAEAGGQYDVGKFIDWTFDGDAKGREGWGVIVGNWGGYDVSGLSGSTTDRGGYAFAMNTFDLAWPLTALVRYDQRYARAVGRWMLNATNAARLFYPDGLPDSLQALPDRKAITRNAIAYEGLIRHSSYPGFEKKPLLAQGDGPLWAPGNPPESMFSIYGSAHVGIFGATVRPTDVEKILQIDCRATDMFRRHEAYPTYLFYNPYSETKTVTVDVGPKKVAVYDSVARRFIANNVRGRVPVELDADAARVLVLVPMGMSWETKDGKLWAGGVPVDFRY